MSEEQVDPSWQAILDAFNNGLIEPIKELVREYRLYHDENGNITHVSDSNWNHIESNNYVVVDEAIHKEWIKYRVRNGKAELKPTDATTEVLLIKGSKDYLVVANNPALLLEDGEQMEDTEYYDRRIS